MGVSGAPNCGNKSWHCVGCSRFFGDIIEGTSVSGLTRSTGSLIHDHGATGTAPATPKGGSRQLVSRDFEIPQALMPPLSSQQSVVATLPPFQGSP